MSPAHTPDAANAQHSPARTRPAPAAATATRALANSAWPTFLAAAIPALALYLATVAPSLPTGDSGEVITAAATFGVAHPPGYPLYVWLGRAWIELFAWGNVAFQLNVMSAVFAALAAGLTALAVRRLTRSALAGLAGGWMLAASAPLWKNAIVAEVFAPNAALAAAALLAFVTLLSIAEMRTRGARRAGATPRRSAAALSTASAATSESQPASPIDVPVPNPRSRAPWAVLGLLATLLLSLHHTLVLLMLPILSVCFAIPALRPRGVERNIVALAAIIGLLPLKQLALVAHSKAALVWGDGSTLRGLLRQLLRADYGTFQLAPHSVGASSGDSHGLLYLASLPAAVGWCGAALAAIGAIVVIQRHRALAAALGGFTLLQAVFFMRAGLPAALPIMRSVIERFYVLPNVCVALLAGVGCAALAGKIPRPRLAALLIIAAITSQPLVMTARALGPRNNHFAENMGRGILASVPPNGVVFVRGDLYHNALEYLTRVEHMRPDVAVIDQELLTYDWYVRQVRARYPGLLPPLGGAERVTLRNGRVFDGWVARRAGGKVALLDEHSNALADSADVLSYIPMPSSATAFQQTRAGFHEGWLTPRDDDRYSGLPGTRNLLWLDWIVPRRPVMFLGFKEDSWTLGYGLVPEGLGLRAYALDATLAIDQRIARELEIAQAVDLADYFRPWPRASFEMAERHVLAEFATRAMLLLCQPSAAALATGGGADGRARLVTFAEQFERLEPTPDPACLRSVGYLRVYDPGFRDLSNAKSDLDRYLATQPTGSDADQTRQLRVSLGS